MTDFKVIRALSTDLFVESGIINPRLIIEEGCWYLCTDTAGLFLGVSTEDGLTLKRINDRNPADIPTDVPTGGDAARIIIDAFIDEKTGMLHLIYSDDTEDILGPVVGKDGIDGKDGLTTAVQVNGVVYNHENSIITLPNFITEHQDLSAYATTEFVNKKIAEAELAEKEADLEAYYTKSEVDAKIPSLDGYAKVEDIPTDYIKASELEGYSKFSGSYNDLTDKPTIPSIEGLATEDYVNNAIANIEHPANPTKVSDLENDAGYITSADIPETDLSNYYTKTEVDTKLLDIKATDVPFTSAKFVAKAFGGFAVGDDLNGLTVAQLFAKLLELTDTKPGENPDVPGAPGENATPEEIVDYLVNKQATMYSQDEAGNLVETPFAANTWTQEEAAVQMDGVSTIYHIEDESGTVIESGYQEATDYNEEAWLTVALPSEIKKVKVKMYDSDVNDWVYVNWKVAPAEEQTMEGYIIWTVPEEYEVMSGDTYRFVIVEEKGD